MISPYFNVRLTGTMIMEKVRDLQISNAVQLNCCNVVRYYIETMPILLHNNIIIILLFIDITLKCLWLRRERCASFTNCTTEHLLEVQRVLVY